LSHIVDWAVVRTAGYMNSEPVKKRQARSDDEEILEPCNIST